MAETFDVPLLEEGLDVAEEAGPADGEPMVFLHGWPDDGRLWAKQVAHFSAQGWRCVCLELPNFGRSRALPWGQDFDVLAARLLASLRAVRRGPEGRVVMVAHDWGAYTTHVAERKEPRLFRALVNFDVSPSPLFTPWTVAVAAVYQGMAVLCFLLGRLPCLGTPIADRLLRAFVRWVLPPLALYGRPGMVLSPTPLKDVRASMGYPYLYTWLRGYFWAKWVVGGYRGWVNRGQIGELPSCPTLHLYGLWGMQLTNPRWADALNKRGDHSRAVGFQTHHWLMHTHPEEVNKEMDEFLTSVR